MDSEASPSTWNISYSLLIALYYEREDIASLLLDLGADVNVVGGEYGTALAAAAYRGEMNIVSLLLDRGADVNSVDGEYGTVLAVAVAAYRGKTDIVPLLLDRGADVNAVGGRYGTALAMAAFQGKTDIVSLLLDRGANVNLVDGEYGTALAAAAYVGGMDIVSLLLDRGANINHVGGKYGTALVAAACGGKMDIVSLLLDRGADVNSVDGEYAALAAAAFYGRMRIVSLLLDRGANVNAVGGKYGAALAAAALTGGTDIVSLLLDRGANVNAVGGKYGAALAAATLTGETDIVSLLLDRGANVNLVGCEYGTALATAAFLGRMRIVSLLLDRGANVNAVGGKYGAALAAAAFQGETDIVSLLLDRGANVNLVDGEYGTALAAAAYGGGMDIVSLLLDRGADFNTVGGEYGTALAAATFQGETDIVSLLLDRGANVNAVGGEYGTALVAAAYRGKTDIVSLLLDRGADVNSVGGEYGTALAAAAYGGGMDIVSLLLDRGANVNAVGGEYGTALATAAYGGEMDIVPLLLDRGANVNAVGGEYGTALATAAYRGKTDIVSLLLDRGADVNSVGGEYGTALATAAFQGETDIVSLLLDRGANINQVGGKYGTAFATAVARCSPRTTSLLLDHGADINFLADENCIPLLTAAAFEGITNIVSLLLDRGTDVNTVCRKYGTVLAAAASGGRTDTVSLLLERGSDVMRVGEKHVTPVNSKISWPPFPMPYTGPYHHRGGASSSTFTLPTKACVGGNLTPEQANFPCPKLTEEVLWNALAAFIGLEDTALAKHQWIRYDLCYFVAHHFDFGLAYAAARVAWKHFEYSMNPSIIFARRSQWHRHVQMLEEEQSKVIGIGSNQVQFTSSGEKTSSVQAQQELIRSPYSIMPRRLWDLKSNRVVDFQMLHAGHIRMLNPVHPTIENRPTFWAVTHSWTSDMSPVWTAINQFQWPVPLPKDITLEYLRSELLTLGAEYVWLDVICLRQKTEVNSLEELRQQEWKIDVPTIGNIYRAAAKIVRYFNGLGVPFRNDGWDDSRHWLRRAWTLQEIASEKNTINGGIPRNRSQRQSQRRVFLNSEGWVSEKLVKFRSVIDPVIQLATQVDGPYGCEIYELAREMAMRHATEPLDKLSGLFYLLGTTELPCYDEHKTSEDIWRQCFHLLPLERKVEVLFDFPYRGSDEQWLPTWAQVLAWPTRDPDYNHIRSHISKDLVRNTFGETSLIIRNIWIIHDANLYETEFSGEYEVEINGNFFGFYLPYLDQKPIDVQDPSIYTLATVNIGHALNWIICKAIEKRFEGVVEVSVLKKWGVMRTDSCSELLVGGQNGVSLLQKVDCLFI